MTASPTLPQRDVLDADGRRQRLYATRQQYKYDRDYLAPLSMLFIPHAWPPSLEEDVIGPLRDLPEAEAVKPEYLYPRWAPAFSTLESNLASARPDPNGGLRAYEQLFPELLPPPRSIQSWQSDGYFAYQRLNGPNPMVIRQLTRADELPKDFSVTDGLFQRVTGQRGTLADEIDEGRIFLADYDLLAPAEGVHVFPDPADPKAQTSRYLAAPFGLFWWNPGAKQLEAIAIQLERVPSAQNPVYTRDDDPDTWLRAKTFFQVSDLNHHELSTHLCRAHLALEVFPVATARQLADTHPIHVLLRPHFEAMIFNNFQGRQLLLSPGGALARLLAPPLEKSLEIIKASYRAWDFRQLNPVTELAERRLDNGVLNDAFFYRADAIKVWDAIRAFVHDYVRVYYRSDADVAGDTELQGWAHELASPAGGNVRRFPDQIQTIEQLVSTVAPIIFACGPQHAAVNFPQWDYVAFTPNMPGAAYRTPQEAKSVLDILSPTPALNIAGAMDQLKTVFTLTCYRYGRLGQYGAAIADEPAQHAVEAFQGALAAVHTAVDERNRSLPPDRQYPYLDPELIPNSNNI
jgi:arachidonate 15-lipoxygenase